MREAMLAMLHTVEGEEEGTSRQTNNFQGQCEIAVSLSPALQIWLDRLTSPQLVPRFAGKRCTVGKNMKDFNAPRSHFGGRVAACNVLVLAGGVFVGFGQSGELTCELTKQCWGNHRALRPSTSQDLRNTFSTKRFA